MFKALKKAFKGGGSAQDTAEMPGGSATDIPAVAGPPRIRDKYPEIAKIAVNLSSRAPFEKIEPTIRGFSMGPDALANFVFRCKNTECVEGGFELTEEIDNMIKAYETNAHGRRVCQGWEGKSNIGHQRCYYELNFVINISYS